MRQWTPPFLGTYMINIPTPIKTLYFLLLLNKMHNRMFCFVSDSIIFYKDYECKNESLSTTVTRNHDNAYVSNLNKYRNINLTHSQARTWWQPVPSYNIPPGMLQYIYRHDIHVMHMIQHYFYHLKCLQSRSRPLADNTYHWNITAKQIS